MAVLLGLDVAFIATLLNYANDNMHCWQMNAMGMYILCQPEIPIWTWLATIAVAFALLAGLVGLRRSSIR